MLRLNVDASSPDMATLERAAGVIRLGRLVAMPTDTLYALAADPFSDDAVRRIFAAKGRQAGQALPLVASSLAQVVRHIGRLPPLAERLARRFWPGPLTLLLDAPDGLAAGVAAETGRVGVRVPAHIVARELCRVCDRPLIATSANPSGEPPSDDPDDVVRSMGARIDALVDAGKTAGGPPSAIVDVLDEEPRLIRAGAISWSDVQACLRG